VPENLNEPWWIDVIKAFVVVNLVLLGFAWATWLERKALFARTVTIKVRYDDFTTLTRSHTAPATRDEDAIAARAVALLERTDAGRRPVRLLGVSVHNLCESDSPEEEVREPRLPFEHA
jgi:DNA polymerase-4